MISFLITMTLYSSCSLNKATDERLVSLLCELRTDKVAYNLHGADAVNRFQAQGQKFDKYVDGLRDRSVGRYNGIEAELIKIADDRGENPELYREIENLYMYTNARPGARAGAPVQPDIAHVSGKYRYVWEYLSLRPRIPSEVNGFFELCLGSVRRSAGASEAFRFFSDYANAVASTPLKGVGIDRLVLSLIDEIEFDQVMFGANVEACGYIARIGSTWNVHHKDAKMNYQGTIETEIAKIFAGSADTPAIARLENVWSTVNSESLTADDRRFVARVNTAIAAAKQSKMTNP